MIAIPIENLIDQLARLPGVGRKTASRLAFHILRSPEHLARDLAKTLVEVTETIAPCERCGILTEVQPCRMCTASRREDTVLCVVKGTPEVLAMERTGAFSGRYHVLGGVLSPLEGVGPDQLRIQSLLKRLDEGSFEEVVVATDPSVDGEATAHYLARLLRPRDLRVSRIASGVPMGASLEYADQVTLARALEGRREIR